MLLFSMSNEDIEEQADVIKVSILDHMVKDGIISKDKADDWAGNHTVLHRKKSLFRTISDRWSKEKVADDTYYYITVEYTPHGN